MYIEWTKYTAKHLKVLRMNSMYWKLTKCIDKEKRTANNKNVQRKKEK